MAAFGDASWVALFGMTAVLAVVALVRSVMTRRPGGGITAKLGNLEVKVDAIHDSINDRPEGTPTISQQVALMAVQVAQLDAKVDTLTDALAAHVLANPGLPSPPRGPTRPRYGY